jgi:hypothetical protein
MGTLYGLSWGHDISYFVISLDNSRLWWLSDLKWND